MKKKVLFVATVTGHINAFHIPYLKMLNEQGYEVHVASNGEEKIEYCDKHFNIPFERNPVKLKNIKAYKELKKVINDERYDIIHCHTPVGGVLTRLAAKKVRKNGTIVIYTAHGFHFYKGAPLINWLIYYPIEKWLAKYVDTIITINREDYDIARKNFTHCKDIQYIPGVGVETEKFDFVMNEEEKNILRESLGINKNDFVLIYPARLAKDKNHKLLLELMKKINNKRIILLLPGTDEMMGFCEKKINEYHLNNVKVLGFRKDIPKLLKISHILVSSSIREGFGVNLVEALYSHIPIIAVDNRGHRDIVDNNKNGFLVKNQVDDLEKQVLKLYYNKEIYKRLKAFTYKSAEKFSTSNSLKIMKGIYDKNESK